MLPETCRVVISIKLEFSASVGFIRKEFVTMHSHMIVKKKLVNRNLRHKIKVGTDEEKKYVHIAGCQKLFIYMLPVNTMSVSCLGGGGVEQPPFQPSARGSTISTLNEFDFLCSENFKSLSQIKGLFF